MEKHYKTGFTFGVYDLFHIGHLNLLRRAKERCDRLIVGISDDLTSVTFKGKQPIIPVEQRAEIVRAVRYVDEVYILGPEYASKKTSWQRFHYDCFFSGDDWINDEGYITEGEWLRQQGSDLVFFPYTQGCTSTDLRDTVRLEQNGLEGKLSALFDKLLAGEYTKMPPVIEKAISDGLKIAFYGCGGHGLELYRRLGDAVCCFVDKYKGGADVLHENIPVYTLREFRNREPAATLLVTPHIFAENAEQREQLLDEFCNAGIKSAEFFGGAYPFAARMNSPHRKEQGRHVMSRLGDGLSQYFFYEFIRSRLEGDPFRQPWMTRDDSDPAPELFDPEAGEVLFFKDTFDPPNTAREHNPVVAVELVARPAGIINIPLALERYAPENLLFIRKYGSGDSGLVIYAVPPERLMR